MISFEIIAYDQSSQINDYWAKNSHSLYLGGPLSQDICYCYLGLGFSGVVGQASGDRCVCLPFVQRDVHALLSGDHGACDTWSRPASFSLHVMDFANFHFRIPSPRVV